MNILDHIVAHKKKELEARKLALPLPVLKNDLVNILPKYSLKQSLEQKQGFGIISEFKRQSPSKGLIHAGAPLEEIILGYAEAGAAGLSVLTESEFFKGSDNDFIQARKLNSLPMIRKDFMIDEYQFYEANLMGADAVLLIASILDGQQVRTFTELAHNLGMEVLLEVHSKKEFEKSYFPEIDLVGVNNRDLTSFEVNIQTSLDLAKIIPHSSLRISESGISNPKTVRKLMEAGYKGFLIGENFMKEKNPGLALKEFIEAI